MNPRSTERSIVASFSVLLLVLLLAACQTRSPATPSALTLPEGFDPLTAQAREPLSDEIGLYRSASSRAAESDDGVTISVEERFYIATSLARFVVTQNNLAARLAGPGISAIGLRLYRGDVTVSDSDLTIAAAAPHIPNELFATALFPADMSRAGSGDRTCAVLDVTFTDEAWYPLSLNTCDQRSLRLLSGT